MADDFGFAGGFLLELILGDSSSESDEETRLVLEGAPGLFEVVVVINGLLLLGFSFDLSGSDASDLLRVTVADADFFLGVGFLSESEECWPLLPPTLVDEFSESELLESLPDDDDDDVDEEELLLLEVEEEDGAS